ncbi:Response regulator receiver domain-containing protein [Hymenobacter daecheongensis DSM 21074]|uniref:Response regulator receiver domain-containing protein n=1 Tax=Hymenobacter daecheongensis DSM 21074 TaxID=1121955 RepID=A0A1M6CC51_9BACT|nr:response regulator [Hymenobacter daecheongensis]SHI58364.1 Response regulator receiver domain-containing protein [Hymenobacter daecheongensis DSM 21074]
MSSSALNPSILLVEDDQMDIMNVQRELRKHDISAPLHIARNGREALQLLRGEGGQAKISKPTIVLLDINMPRMNGLELLDTLRSDPEFVGLNVFIMTTSDLETDRLKARELAVSGYIIKPLSFEKFGEGGTTVDGFSLFLDLLKLKE